MNHLTGDGLAAPQRGWALTCSRSPRRLRRSTVRRPSWATTTTKMRAFALPTRWAAVAVAEALLRPRPRCCQANAKRSPLAADAAVGGDVENDFLQAPPVSSRRDPLCGLAVFSLHAKLPDRLVTDLDPALGQQLLDVPEAQGEAEVEPDAIADHLRREPVTLERDRSHPATPLITCPSAAEWRRFIVCLTAPPTTRSKSLRVAVNLSIPTSATAVQFHSDSVFPSIGHPITRLRDGDQGEPSGIWRDLRRWCPSSLSSRSSYKTNEQADFDA